MLVISEILKFISFGAKVEVVDPYANSEDLKHEYGFGLIEKPSGNYDAVVVAVNHEDYKSLDENYFKSISSSKGVLVDLKGIFRGKIKELTYWSL